MSSVINVTAAVAAAQTQGPRPRGLDADLAKAQGQLSDWVNCPSAKTATGRAKIEEISARIESIKATLKKADSAAPARRSTLSPLGAYVDLVA